MFRTKKDDVLFEERYRFVKMISIVNYGRGNIYSIQNALTFCNIEHNLIQHPDDVVNADKLLLLGVGAFADTMRLLKKIILMKQSFKQQRRGRLSSAYVWECRFF